MTRQADREKREEIAKVLHEYGDALRGDWGSIDGRSERTSIQTMARWVADPSLFPASLEAAREEVGICSEGFGHWQMYCHDSFTECTWSDDGDS